MPLSSGAGMETAATAAVEVLACSATRGRTAADRAVRPNRCFVCWEPTAYRLRRGAPIDLERQAHLPFEPVHQPQCVSPMESSRVSGSGRHRRSDHSATGDYGPGKTPQARPSQSARSNPWPAAGRTERRLKASSARRKGYTNAHRGRRRDRRHACRRCAPGSCLPDCCTAPTASGRRQ